VRYLFYISILLAQVFAFSFKGDAKEWVHASSFITSSQQAIVENRIIEEGNEYLPAGTVNIVSALKNTPSFRTPATDRYGTDWLYLLCGINAQLFYFTNAADAFTHTPIALLLLFPKHYFW
jgi:hypothetical protein